MEACKWHGMQQQLYTRGTNLAAVYRPLHGHRLPSTLNTQSRDRTQQPVCCELLIPLGRQLPRSVLYDWHAEVVELTVQTSECRGNFQWSIKMNMNRTNSLMALNALMRSLRAPANKVLQHYTSLKRWDKGEKYNLLTTQHVEISTQFRYGAIWMSNLLLQSIPASSLQFFHI